MNKPTKGIIFYSDNMLPSRIAEPVMKQLQKISDEKGLPIVSATLQKMDFGIKNIHFPHLKRGVLTMFKQILAALEHSEADIVFFCEADVLYHPSHFDYNPPQNNVYYYNTNVWKVRFSDGYSVRIDDSKQVSGLCGYRELLTGHYRRRVAKILQNQKDLAAMGRPVKNEGFSRHMGYEPGLHSYPRGVDEYKTATWESPFPNLDIRHGSNFTVTRWTPEGFHKPGSVAGWREADAAQIHGWEDVRELIEIGKPE